MNKYEVYGYENYQILVATIYCNTLDEASQWAQSNLGSKGWSAIYPAN